MFLMQVRFLSDDTKQLIQKVTHKAKRSLKDIDFNEKKALIIELDALLELCLNEMLGKRPLGLNLQIAKKVLLTPKMFEKSYQAHDYRNTLAHNPNKTLNVLLLKNCIKDYIFVLNSLYFNQTLLNKSVVEKLESTEVNDIE